MAQQTNMTAVQWLGFELNKRFTEIPTELFEEISLLFEQAKQMEKQQIIDANYDGQRLHAKSVTNLMLQDNAESYYNETFKN